MSNRAHRLTLRADDARRVALVWAAESVDPGGRLLDLDARLVATRDAQAASGSEPRRFMPPRARALADRLTGAGGALPAGLLRWTDPMRGMAMPSAAVALIAGLATNALGTHQVHVLALPLLGILGWNVTMLILLLARRIVTLPGAGRLARALTGLRQRAGQRFLERALLERAQAQQDTEGGEQAAEPASGAVLRRQAIARFLGLWTPASAPLAMARAERALHAAALAIAAGVVAGMYLRGLGLAYQATWESTFLGAETVQSLLDAVLGPAAALIGIPVPSVAAIEAPASGPAAPWIHLWAATTAWLVGLPRLLLFGLASARCARRRARLDLDLPAGYLQRLISAADPNPRQVEVVAFSYRPTAPAVSALKSALLDLFGARASVRNTALAYGDEASPADAATRCRVLLFSLAQTPEDEVHGALVRRAVRDLRGGQSLAVLIDASTYRLRLGAGAKKRLAERRRAWERTMAETPLEAAFVDLAATGDVSFPILERAYPEGSLDDLRRLE